MTRVLHLALVATVLPVVLYTTVFYGVMPNVFPVKVAWQVDPVLRDSLRSHVLALYLHVVPSALALLLGALQLRPGARGRLHRLSGRLYAGAVLLGGAAGLYLALFSFAGPVSQLGFALLALLWLLFTGLAVRAIRAGDVAGHRAWMLRSYALTLAGLTLRLYNQVGFGSGYELADFHALNAWACWVPNWVLAELWIRTRPAPVPAGGVR